jgi:hypothetical protein
MRKFVLAGAAVLAGLGAFGPALAQPRGDSADDVGANAGAAGRLSLGREASGEIETVGDRDWRRIRLRAGQAYRFTLVGSGASALADPYLSLFGPAGGEAIAFNDDADGRNSAIDFAPTQSGDYYLEARAFNDEGTGGYTLKAERVRPPSATASLTIGESVAGAIDPAGERDRYRVRLTGGQVYRISLTKAAEGGIDDPFLGVYQPGAAAPSVTDDDGGGDFNSYLEYTAPTTGDYLVEARGFSETATGAYTLRVIAGDTPADASTDVTLTPNPDVTRLDRISPAGDADWFRVELTAGQTIRIQLNSAGEQTTALSDPMLVVHGPDGGELASDDDGGGGLNSALEFTAETAGPHFLEARGFGEGVTGGYALSVRSGEISNSADSDETLAPENARTSTINASGDADWFSVAMIEGRTYRFNLTGAEGEGALANPKLTIHDSEGAVVASDDDGGAGVNSYLSFIPTVGGTYYAAASAAGDGTGRYMLRVSDTETPSDLNTDEELNGEDDARQGRIDFVNDRDAYRIAVRPGMRYTVRVASAAQHGLGDPFVAVRNDRGDELGSNDDERRGSQNAAFTFTAPASPSQEGPDGAAVVYAVASGFNGSMGDYVITVAPAPQAAQRK